MIEKKCERCGITFSYEKGHGRQRKYCGDCVPQRIREYQREYQREYEQRNGIFYVTITPGEVTSLNEEWGAKMAHELMKITFTREEEE
jgi:hypothetical protein